MDLKSLFLDLVVGFAVASRLGAFWETDALELSGRGLVDSVRAGRGFDAFFFATLSECRGAVADRMGSGLVVELVPERGARGFGLIVLRCALRALSSSTS